MKYIIYCRKSSEDEDRQAQSLETQVSLLNECAKRNNLTVVDTLQESRSAKNPNNRPLFISMIERIKNGEIDGILVAHIDRLSRNGSESAIITNLLEERKLKEIRTPSNTFNSAQDILYMDINFAFSSYYSRNLSIRVKEGFQNKLNKGEFPNQAPTGYFNKEGKIYPDPEKVPYIKRAFELYATGNYSLKQLGVTLYDEGFRPVRGGKIRKSSLEHLLKNRTYIGEIDYNGKIYPGIHEPIISRELFNQVQAVTLNVARPRVRKLNFLYRGFVKCAVCGCMFTTAIKIKKSGKQYIYYYCTNGRFLCDQHKDYMKDTDIKDLAVSIFKPFSEAFDSEIAQLSLEAYVDNLKKDSGNLENTRQNFDIQIKKNKEKQGKLLDLLMDETITKEVYNTKLEELKSEERELTKHKNNVKEVNPITTLELLESFKNKAISLPKVFLEGDDEVKKDLLNSALWNFSVKDHKVASIRYKTLYEKVSKVTKNANFDQWLSIMV